MRAMRRFLKRLATTAMRRQNEERLRDEIEEHLALQTTETSGQACHRLRHAAKPC